VRTPVDKCVHAFAHDRPLVHHHVVAESQHEVSLHEQLEIAPPVLLELGAGMKPLPIHLDDQPVANEQIHESNPWYVHLRAMTDPTRPKQKPHLRLDAGLRAGGDPIKEVMA